MRGIAILAVLALAAGSAHAEKVVIPDLHASSALVGDEAIAVTLLVRSAIARDDSSTLLVDSFPASDAAAACKKLGADHAVLGELTSDHGLRLELSIVDPAGNFDRATLRAPEGDIDALAGAIVDKIASSTRVRPGVVPPVSLGALRPYAAAIRLAANDKNAAAVALEDAVRPLALAVPAIQPALAGVVDAAQDDAKVIVARAAGDTKLLEELAKSDPAAKALLAIDRASLSEAAAALAKPPKNPPALFTFAQAVLAEHKGEDALLAKAIGIGLGGPLKRTMLAYASTVATRLPAPLVKRLLDLAAQQGTQLGVASRIGLAAAEAGIEADRGFGMIRTAELDNPELARLKRLVAGKTDGATKRIREELAARDAPPVDTKPPVKPSSDVKPTATTTKDEGGGGGVNPLTIVIIGVILLGVIGLLIMRSRGKSSGGKIQLVIDKPFDAVDEVYCIEFSQHTTRPATGEIHKFHVETKKVGRSKTAMRQTMVGTNQTIDAPKGRWHVHLFGSFVRSGIVRPVPANCTKSVEITPSTTQVRFDIGLRSSECGVVVTSEPRANIEVWAGNSAQRARTDARGEAVLALAPGSHTIHLEINGKKVDKSVDVVGGKLARVEVDFARDVQAQGSRPPIDKDAPVEISAFGNEGMEAGGGPIASRGSSGSSQPRADLGAQLQSLIDVDLNTPTPKPATRPTAQQAKAQPGSRSQPKTPTAPPPTQAIMDDLAMPPSITMPPPMAAAPAPSTRPGKAVTMPPISMPPPPEEPRTTVAPRPQRPSQAPERPQRPSRPPPDQEAMRLDIGTFELDAPGNRKGEQSYGIDNSIPSATAPFHDPSAIDVGGGGGGGLGGALASLSTELDGGFLDRFAIVGQLGPGVQLARAQDGTDVEIRTFPAGAPIDDVAKVQHPNVARTLAHALEGSSAYLASEHLGADTLANRLAMQGQMPWHEVVYAIDQVCAGLAALHGKMLAHGNIELGSIAFVGGVTKLSAPMLRGNARDDLAALGRVMYELLCGHPPARPVVRPRTIVPDVPPDLDQLVIKLLEKNTASSHDLRATFKKLLG